MISPERKESVVLPLSPVKEPAENCFAAARKAKGLSVEDVADTLNLGTRVVELLEQNDQDELRDNTYTIGYIRTYAKFLGLDFEEVRASISLKPEEPTSGLTAYGATVEVIGGSIHKRKDRRFVLKLVLLLVLITVGVTYGLIKLPPLEDIGLLGFFEQFSIW